MHLVPEERRGRRTLDGERVCLAIDAVGDAENVSTWAGRFGLLSATSSRMIASGHYWRTSRGFRYAATPDLAMASDDGWRLGRPRQRDVELTRSTTRPDEIDGKEEFADDTSADDD